MDVSDVVRIATVEWKGKTYTLRRQSFETEGFYKDYLERQAVAGVLRYRELMGEISYRDAMQAITRDFAARTYAWGRPLAAESLTDIENFKHFLWLIIRQRTKGTPNPNADFPRELFDQMWDEKADELQEAWSKVTRPADPTVPAETPAKTEAAPVPEAPNSATSTSAAS